MRVNELLVRRRWLAFIVVGWLVGWLAVGGGPSAAQTSPLTGAAVPGLAVFDTAIPALMAKHGLPGGSVAIAKDGRLVYVRGFGYAVKETGEPVEPESRFRIASLSKPVTAAAVLLLVEEGRLRLDDLMLDHLAHLAPALETLPDPRLKAITVEMLLQHTGGWDRQTSGDPTYPPRSTQAAQAMNTPAPPTCETILRYQFTQRLDFEPGARNAYSNLGYCALGRIVERVSGQSFEEFVQSRVWAATGVSGAALGRSRREQRLPGEVAYYDYEGAPTGRSILPGVTGQAPRPYGSFYLEARDSTGGWVITPQEYLRFFTALEGRSGTPLLAAETVSSVDAAPWRPVPPRREVVWTHSGAFAGTATVVQHQPNGVSIAAFFNSRPQATTFDAELGQQLRDLVGSVAVWPAE